LETLLEQAGLPLSSTNLSAAKALSSQGLPVTVSSVQQLARQTETLQGGTPTPSLSASRTQPEVQAAKSLLSFLDQQNPPVQRHLEIQQALKLLDRVQAEPAPKVLQALQDLQARPSTSLANLTEALKQAVVSQGQATALQESPGSPAGTGAQTAPQSFPASIPQAQAAAIRQLSLGSLISQLQPSQAAPVQTQSLAQAAQSLLSQLQDSQSEFNQLIVSTGSAVAEATYAAGSGLGLPKEAGPAQAPQELQSYAGRPSQASQNVSASTPAQVLPPQSSAASVQIVPVLEPSGIWQPGATAESVSVKEEPMVSVRGGVPAESPRQIATPAFGAGPARTTQVGATPVAGVFAPGGRALEAPSASSALSEARQFLASVAETFASVAPAAPVVDAAGLRQVLTQKGLLSPEIPLASLPKEAVMQAVAFLQARSLPVTPALAAPVANTFALAEGSLPAFLPEIAANQVPVPLSELASVPQEPSVAAPSPEGQVPGVPVAAELRSAGPFPAISPSIVPTIRVPALEAVAIQSQAPVSNLVTAVNQVRMATETLPASVQVERPQAVQALAALGRSFEALAVRPEEGNLAPQLQDFVESSGLLHESHLAKEAAGLPVPGSHADLKTALLNTREAVQQSLESPASLSPASRESLQAMAGQVRDALASLTTLQLSNLSLPSQETAVLHIPLWMGREILPGQLSLYWKKGKEARPDDQDPLNMVFQLDTRGLGLVSVFLQLWKEDCNCRVEVASEAARVHVAGHLDSLKAGFEENTPFRLKSLDLDLADGKSGGPSFLTQVPSQAPAAGLNLSA
jgi:hypothetical protein